jgi:NAD(P)H-dependent FMN reductase
MKLLHIDSSVLGPHSVSRQVSAAIVERLRKATPNLQIVYRDLTSTPLAHLSGSHLAAAQGATPEAALLQDLAAGQAVLDEFLAADIVVLGAPMYNFTIPSQLKAWIDRIVVAGISSSPMRQWSNWRPLRLSGLPRQRFNSSAAFRKIALLHDGTNSTIAMLIIVDRADRIHKFCRVPFIRDRSARQREMR